MAEKIIMLACSAGMPTSLLVSKMEAAAKQDGVDYKIFATSAADIDHQLSQDPHPDVLLLGPQVRYMANDVKKIKHTQYDNDNWPKCVPIKGPKIKPVPAERME